MAVAQDLNSSISQTNAGVTSPGYEQFVITASDDPTTGCPFVTRGVICLSTDGAAVTFTAVPAGAQTNGTPVPYQNVPCGVTLPIRISQVKAAGASGNLALVGLA